MLCWYNRENRSIHVVVFGVRLGYFGWRVVEVIIGGGGGGTCACRGFFSLSVLYEFKLKVDSNETFLKFRETFVSGTGGSISI